MSEAVNAPGAISPSDADEDQSAADSPPSEVPYRAVTAPSVPSSEKRLPLIVTELAAKFESPKSVGM